MTLNFRSGSLVNGPADLLKYNIFYEEAIIVSSLVIATRTAAPAASPTAIAKKEKAILIGSLIGSDFSNIRHAKVVTPNIKLTETANFLIEKDQLGKLSTVLLLLLRPIVPRDFSICKLK